MTIERSKKDWLFHQLKHYGVFSKAMVQDFGNRNFNIRAVRTVQEWASEGDNVYGFRVRRIPDDEAILKGLNKKGNAKMAWWELVPYREE